MLEPRTMKTGDIVFNLNNQDGQVLHEFLVVQSDLPADKLPLGADSQVNETGLKIVNRVDKIDVGQSSILTANLAPGALRADVQHRRPLPVGHARRLHRDALNLTVFRQVRYNPTCCTGL